MNKFEFNDRTYAIIYELYDNNIDAHGVTVLLKKGLVLSFINKSLAKQPMFINSNFIWENNTEMNINKINDLSLLVLQKEINSMFQLDKKCESKKNAFGLLKIWIKIMQDDEQIKGDLRNTFSKDYVFNPNPESMNRHIAEVEKEISENPLVNIILS